MELKTSPELSLRYRHYFKYYDIQYLYESILNLRGLTLDQHLIDLV